MFAVFRRRLTARPLGPRYPEDPGAVPPAFRGMPELIADRCRGHALCAEACPSGSLRVAREGAGWAWELDRARCVACGLCAEACPEQAIRVSPEFELAALRRDDLRSRVARPAAAQEAAR